MIEINIFVPLCGNDHEPFDIEHHETYEGHLLRLFGGWTRVEGDVAGAWLGDRRYDDDLRVYVVSISTLLDGGKVRDAVEIAVVHYNQEAIYIRYLGLNEIIDR